MDSNTTPEGVVLTPLRIIGGTHGSVLHALRASESSFAGFGEAYFSTIQGGARKGWKKHLRMTLNLVVPVGCIRFVLVDDRSGIPEENRSFTISLSRDNYQRLTVPPGIWMAFEGQGEVESLLINVANIPHDPQEAVSKSIDDPEMNRFWQ